MIGFFQLGPDVLNEEELKTYRAYYCRLCHSLKLEYGDRSRLLVSYDVVIYMLIAHLATGETFPLRQGVCSYKHPKELAHFTDDSFGKSFALFCLIGFLEIVNDKLVDGKRLKYKLAKFFYRKPFKKSVEKNEALAEHFATQIELLRKLEKERHEPTVYLNHYASCMANALKILFPSMDENHLALAGDVASWSYFMDMILDYDDDLKKGQFNPLIKDNLPFFEYVNANWYEIENWKKQFLEKLQRDVKAIEREKTEWFILAKAILLAIPKNMEIALVDNKRKKYFDKQKSTAGRRID